MKLLLIQFVSPTTHIAILGEHSIEITYTAAVDPGHFFGWAQDSDTTEVTENIVVKGESIVEPPQRGSIATKLDVPIKDTPASVSVVTSTLIKRQDGDVLGDALRNISGINIQSGSGVYDYFPNPRI